MIRTRKAPARAILTASLHPERANPIWHLDPITELGCVFKREIPKGEAMLDWLNDENEIGLIIAGLRGRNFTWQEIQTAMFDLTRARWLPPIEQLQLTYRKTLEAHGIAARVAKAA